MYLSVCVCFHFGRERTVQSIFFFCESLKVSEEVSRQLASMPHGCDAKKHFRAMIFRRILGLTRPTASPKPTPRAAQSAFCRSSLCDEHVSLVFYSQQQWRERIGVNDINWNEHLKNSVPDSSALLHTSTPSGLLILSPDSGSNVTLKKRARIPPYMASVRTRRKRSRRQKSSSMGVSGTQAVSPASMACHDQRTNQCSAATKGCATQSVVSFFRKKA